uniref:Amino acid transporter transmembrane domain-containing protein n=1 Tax=Chromera velia CCMP2878 TaxID=1169474 RepID=A0A0G4GI50_9ALVE|eukprot:Cvel_4747.t1-p1 / transcript=Cvel_4747.t1 / gene=Cvel_4747 / organism=Chromera_velia_CCMP2878 / gene_product=hypothetical protein / transcript_product=hypothetical protein / location=Cvel_scaffold211:92768-100889(+) / protein_length=630 / sequence_SO=supercontig / SO=protein_coding / is_pseudo=false
MASMAPVFGSLGLTTQRDLFRFEAQAACRRSYSSTPDSAKPNSDPPNAVKLDKRRKTRRMSTMTASQKAGMEIQAKLLISEAIKESEGFRGFEVASLPDSAKADMAIRPLGSKRDLWLAVQVKSTACEWVKGNSKSRTFSRLNRGYGGMVVVCIFLGTDCASMSDKKREASTRFQANSSRVWSFPGSFPFPKSGGVAITPGGKYDGEEFRCSWKRSEGEGTFLGYKLLSYYEEAERLGSLTEKGVHLWTLRELEEQIPKARETERKTLRWLQPLFDVAGLRTFEPEDPTGPCDIILYSSSGSRPSGLRLQLKTAYWFGSRPQGPMAQECMAVFIILADNLYDVLRIPLWKSKLGLLLVQVFFFFLRDLSGLGFTSFVGVAFSLVLGISLVSACAVSMDSLKWKHLTLYPATWAHLAESTGVILCSNFCVTYHDFRQNLETPKAYDVTIVVTHVLAFLINVSVGVGGAVLFAGNVQPELTTNLSEESNSIGRFAVWALILVTFTKAPLYMRLLSDNFESFFLPGVDVTQPRFENHGFRVALRLLISLVPFVGAVLFPHFEELVSALGSVLTSLVCIGFPALMALCTSVGKNAGEQAAFVVLIFLSGAIACLGVAAIGWKLATEGPSRTAGW